MKSNGINLNKIFKAPLFRAISIMAMFVGLLCVRGIFASEKVDAYSDFEIYETSSGWSASGATLTTSGTDKSSYYFYVYHTTDATDLRCIALLEGTTVLAQNGDNYGYCGGGDKAKNYSDDYTKITFSTSYSSVGYTRNWDRCSGGCYEFTLPLSYMHKEITLFSGGFWAADKKTFKFVDKSAPTVPSSYSNSSGGNWTNQNVDIVVSGSTDYISGVAKYQYSYDKSSWKEDWNSGYINYGTWSAERDNYVYFRACDGAGNCSAATSWYTRVRIDKTFPTFDSYELHGSAAFVNLWTNSQTVVGSASGTDNTSGSGIGKVYFKEGSTTLYTSTSNISEASFNLANNNAGEHTVSIYVCDKASNCVYITVVMYYDKTAPLISEFSTTVGTTGDDGNKYVTDSSFSPTVNYSDNMNIVYLVISNICTFASDSVILGATTDYPSFTPSTTCDLSSVAVDYDNITGVALMVFDAAGNYATATINFYRIDTTRKISIDSFNISAKGSLSNNWIGTQSTTGGEVAPIYTLSNDDYISRKYMYIWTQSALFLTGLRPIVACSNCSNIVGTIKSGTYVSFESGYNGYYSSTSAWYAAVEDGDKDWWGMTLKNIYGQTTYVSKAVQYDLVNPTVSSYGAVDNDTSNDDITPVSGYTNSQSIKHSMSASDSNLYRYKVLDGSSTIYSLSATSPNGVSDSLANTTNGTHTLKAYAYDKAGNAAYKTYNIIYDSVDPTISSYSAADNDSSNNDITPAAGYTNSQSIKHSLSASDTNIYKYKVLDGSTTIYSLSTTTPNGVADSLANTTEGTHTLKVYVYDKAGNGVYTSYNIVYDVTDPTISSYSATDNDSSNNDITPAAGYTNSQAIKHSLSASDTNIWKYKVLDGTATIYSLSTTSPNGVGDSLTNTTEGTHTLKVYVYDKAGNGVYASYNIVYDVTDPTISSYSATDNDSSNNDSTPLAGYTNSQSIKHSLSASDTNIWKYKVLDGTATIYGLSTTSPNGVGDSLNDKTNGNHVLKAYVYDKAGNGVYASYTIVYDDIDPSFSSGFKVVGNTCAVSGYTNQTNVTYTGVSAVDANPYLYQVTDNGTTINSWSDTAPTGGTLANTTNGSHSIILYMIDKAGNSGYTSFNIVLDTVAPTFTGFNVVGTAGNKGGLTPSAGYTATTSVSFTLTGIGDATSGVHWYRVMDGSSNMYAKGTTKQTSGTLANTTNGTHTIKYTIWDKACNSKEITDTIILDTIRPVVNITTDTTVKTTVINFSDTYLKTNAKIGSNYAYYMSESGSVTLSSVTTIAAKGTTANGSDVPMYVSGQSYYLYIMTKEITRDHAGNVPAPSSPISIYGTALISGYSGYTYKVAMNVNTSDYGDSSVPIDPDKLVSDSQSKATEYKVDVMLKDRTLMITVQREKFSGAVSITLAKLNEVLATAGYKILGVGNSTSHAFTKSAIYHDVLISKTDHTQNEIIDLIFVVEAPSKS